MIARSRKPISRKSRPRTRRKGKRASLAREADRLWSLIVRRRGTCEMDGTHAGPLQGAHGFSRRYRGTRWLLINGVALCAKHHVVMTHDPLAWTAWLKTAWGDLVYEELERIARMVSTPDHAAIVAQLREELGE